MNDLPTRRAFNRRGAAEIERRIEQALDEQAAERARERAAAREQAAAERARRGTVTWQHVHDAIETAPAGVAVRDDTGLHVVLRLNDKSVTIPGPWGGTRTVRIDRLLEVRS